jgi:hypothetical protein
VTYALDKVFPVFTSTGVRNTNFFPIATNALGGIMLFNDPLTESVSNVRFPHNKIIGMAGQTQNSDNAFLGSFNSLESMPITDGFRTVWDFSTAQANGTISSVARTHKNIANGICDLCASSEVNCDINDSGNFLYIDAYTQEAYYLVGTSIYKAYTPTNGIPVGFNFGREWKIEDTGEVLEEPDIFRSSRGQYTKFYWGFDGYVYTYELVQENSKWKLTWHRMKCSDKSFTVQKNYAIFTLDNKPADFNAYGYTGQFLVVDGYAYIFAFGDGSTSGDYTRIYKLNMSNTSDITEIPLAEDERSYSYMRQLASGVIHLSNTSTHEAMLIYPNLNNSKVKGLPMSSVESRGFFAPTSVTADSILYVGKQLNGGFGAGNNYVCAGYLGTIANISSVTKTASQSMKITYTLTNS